jgi:uncharacterized DUF497 family protein
LTYYFNEAQNTHVTWDPAKSAENERQHGLSFEVAAEIFQDQYRLEEFDAVHGDREDRWAIIGLVGSVGYVIRVTHNDLDTQDVRIVSARRADRTHINRYLQQRGHHA